jgi:hypothetical protein
MTDGAQERIPIRVTPHLPLAGEPCLDFRTNPVNILLSRGIAAERKQLRTIRKHLFQDPISRSQPFLDVGMDVLVQHRAPGRRDRYSASTAFPFAALYRFLPGFLARLTLRGGLACSPPSWAAF